MLKMLQIAIDGPAGAGKSSIARKLAERLEITYLDTGGLFRSFAYGLKRDGIPPDDIPSAEELLARYRISLERDGRKGFYLNDEDVTEAIRTNAMSGIASDYSRLPNLREAVLVLERRMADTFPVVMDGRDIGSVVLPDAPFKIFLTASAEERAKRRYKELYDKGQQDIAYEAVLAEIEERDRQDRTRPLAPLIRVPEAFYLDTTELAFEEVIEAILDYIAKEARRSGRRDLLRGIEEARNFEA